MFNQLRKIIREGEKVEIIYKGKSFLVKKQDLYNKIEILCRNKEEPELNFILGTIIAVRAMKLKDGIIYCYFQKANFDEDRPELKIERQGDLYRLLKGMKDFD